MPYVEHVPTVGELILEPFFGKKRDLRFKEN